MNKALLDSNVQQVIRDHSRTDLDRLLLSKNRFSGVSQRELAEQIESRGKCEKKLPLWYATPGIYYPPKLSVEQASSELTARYKSALLSGTSAIDLTGGMGVDAYFFSQRAERVMYCELNAEIAEIAQHNSALLGASNCEHLAADGPEYLVSGTETYDTVYIDPARRSGSSKVFRFKDCTPDITAYQDRILARCSRLVIKSSPLLDLHAGMDELSGISEIHVVSVKNECREVLWVSEKAGEKEPLIVCAAIDTEGQARTFTFRLSEERAAEASFADPQNFLYEPDAALLKAGCFKLTGTRFGLKKLDRHSHLYTSDELKPGFIGKTFRIEEILTYKAFAALRVSSRANVVSRNFPLSTEAVRMKHKIVDGGEEFLFFTRLTGDRLVMIRAKKIVV